MLRAAQAHACRTIAIRSPRNSGCGTTRARRRMRCLLRGTASRRRLAPRSNEEELGREGALRGRPQPRPSPIAPGNPERRTPHRTRHPHGVESLRAPAERDTAAREQGASGVLGSRADALRGARAEAEARGSLRVLKDPSAPSSHPSKSRGRPSRMGLCRWFLGPSLSGRIRESTFCAGFQPILGLEGVK